MSLGVKTIWGMRPRISSRLSLIPGESFPSRTRPQLRKRSTAIRARGDAVSKPATSPPAGAALAAEKDDHSIRASTNATELANPIASTFVERLARVPVRRHGPRQSVLVQPPTVYAHKAETRRSQTKSHRAIVRQHRLDCVRIANSSPAPDWRRILWNLGRWTPEYSPKHVDDVIKVIVPQDAIETLVSEGENSARSIRSKIRNLSMKIHLGDSGDVKDELPYVLLSGPREAVGAAVQEILKLSKHITVVALSSGETVIHDGLSATLEANPELLITVPHRAPSSTPRSSRSAAIPPSEIPQPAKWTRRSFLEHTAILVSTRTAPSLSSKRCPAVTSHEQAVITQLHKVFNDPTTRDALSCDALKLALSYMARNGETSRPDIRALYARMETVGLPMDTAVYNILARSAVAAKDLVFFATVLRLMSRRGHAPNLSTWILFLRIIEAEEVRRYILHAMDRRGLFRAPNAVKLVSFELVSADMECAIQQGKDWESFSADQDRLYGNDWFSRSSANKIVEVLGRHGKFDEILTVVDRMFVEPSCLPDTVTLNTVLTHCKLQNNFNEALRVLQRFGPRVSTVADPITYHLLFSMAWKARSPHTMAMIWRYACIVDGTSYSMRRRVDMLLLGGRGARRTLEPFRLESPGEEKEGNDLPHAASTESALLLHEFTAPHAAQEASPSPAGASPVRAKLVAEWYKAHYENEEPASLLSDLLAETLKHDAQVRKDLKEERKPTLVQIELRTRAKPAARGPGDSPALSHVAGVMGENAPKASYA